jgi:hypothetical protein
MKFIMLMVFSLILWGPGLVSAELYKYYNQDGTLSFTDDLSLVPADQRPGVETFHEIQTKEMVSLSPPPDTVATTLPDQTHQDGAGLKSDLDAEFKQLAGVNKTLSEEYIALKERQELLISGGKKAMNPIEIKAYNHQINELNQDTLKYKEKQQAYFKRVEEYNLKVKSAL